ncbi:hypothetical protein BGZ54_008159 [Gamsiella multidivaricata]|nr:hypothetical protein BGZ54_008159 [Gamsiella multidivaricata]
MCPLDSQPETADAIHAPEPPLGHGGPPRQDADYHSTSSNNNTRIPQDQQHHNGIDHDTTFSAATAEDTVPALGSAPASGPAPALRHRSQSNHPFSVDASPSLLGPRLQEHLLQAAHYARDVQNRNQELETENKKLKQLIRQHRTSALDWCSLAKSYQQDRNFMALRLAELELQIAKRAQQHVNDSQATAETSKGRATAARHHDEGSELNNFVSQSISQILDQMAPSKTAREPSLPQLGKGKYVLGNNSNNNIKGEAAPLLRSALKTSSKSSACACGCQEELKSWKSRCAFAENQVTLMEMRCERTIIMMDAYKAKWVEWKEAVSPHMIFDDLDDDLSASEAFDLRGHPPKALVLDSEENDASTDVGSQPMSLTFPSDLALRRRGQWYSESEDDDKSYSDNDNDNDIHKGNHGRFGPRKTFTSVSPTTRASEARRKRIPAVSSNRPTPQQQKQKASNTTTDDASAMLNIQSNQSSPLSDSEDLMAVSLHPSENKSTKDNQQAKYDVSETSRSTSRATQHTATDFTNGPAKIGTHSSGELQAALPQTPKASSRTAEEALSAGHVPYNSRKVFVPETPLELQGSTPKKSAASSVRRSLSVVSPPRGAAQETSDQGSRPPQPVMQALTVDPDDSTYSCALSGVDEPNKENEAPQESITQAHTVVGDGNAGENSHKQGGVDPDHRHEQGHQQQQQRIYNFTERRKDKRKHMHGHDCACCRRFYELTGPLPLPDGHNAFFTPAPRPGEKEVWEKSAEERLQGRIQEISRHRVHHEERLTPPGFWDTDFPSTQDREEWDRIAAERRDRKKQRATHEQQRQQRQRR